MKNRNLVAAATALLALAAPASALANDLAGAWHGVISNLAINIVIAPNQTFTETFAMSNGQTVAKGHIVPFAPGVVTFVVDDWAPKSHPIDRSVTYAIAWATPNKVVFTDVNKHGSITLERVP